MDAKATDLGLVRPKGDIGFRLIEGIEFPAVVTDFNVEAVFRNLQADNDLMLPGVVVAVFDGIGHDFLNGEVGGENDAFGCVIALEKLRRCVGRRGKIIEIAIDLEDDIGHGRKVSDAEDRFQLFAQDEAGSHHWWCRGSTWPKRPAHWQLSTSPSNLIEFVNGLGNRVVRLPLGENQGAADFKHGK